MPFTTGDPKADNRRQHLGWALYARIADTACYLRSPKKCPPPPNLLNRPDLPRNLIWPLSRDWLNCQAMIEAVVMGNLRHLDTVVISYPSHRFGFEEYQFQLRDIIGTSKQGVLSTVGNVAPKATIVSAAELASIRLSVTVPEPGLFARMELIYWDSNQTSLRLRIVHPLPRQAGEQIFTTVLIDTKTGEWGLEEHRPGWYRAYGLSPDLWRSYLGLGRRKPVQRRSLPPLKATGIMAPGLADPPRGVSAEGDACSALASSTTPPKLSEMPSGLSNALSS